MLLLLLLLISTMMMMMMMMIQVSGMRSLVHCFKGDLRWWTDLISGNLSSALLLSHLISNSGGVIEPIIPSDSAPTPAPDVPVDAEDAATPRTPATPSGLCQFIALLCVAF